MDEADESGTEAEPKRSWFEPVCAVLMAVASLSTAWCSYQNSRWSGESSTLETHADKLERQALSQHLEAGQIKDMHVETFMETIDAQMEGNEKLARFYTDRFSEELKPAYEKWIALKPFDNLAAPPHPFVPGLYTPRFEQEVRDAHAEAARADAQSNVAEHYASSYLSNTVLLATVLFFAATAGKFHQRRVRHPSLFFAIAVFLYAAVRMFMLPVMF